MSEGNWMSGEKIRKKIRGRERGERGSVWCVVAGDLQQGRD